MDALWKGLKIFLLLGVLSAFIFGEALAGDFVYVMENAGIGGVSLTKVDLTNATIIWRKKTKYDGMAGYIAVNSKEGKVYISGTHASSPLVKVDVTSGEVEASLAPELLDQIDGPIYLSVDRDKVLIPNVIKEEGGKIEGKTFLLNAKDLFLIKSIPTDHIGDGVFCAEQNLLYAIGRDQIVRIELAGGNIFVFYDLPPSIIGASQLFLAKGCDELLFTGLLKGSEKVSLWRYDLRRDSAKLLSSDFRDIPLGIVRGRIFALPGPNKGKDLQSKELQNYDEEVLRLKKFQVKDREVLEEGEEVITLAIPETLKKLRQEKINEHSKRAERIPEELKDVEWWKSRPLLSVYPSGAIEPAGVTLSPSGGSIVWLIDYGYREAAYLNIISLKDKKIRTIYIGNGATNMVFTSE